LTEEYNSPVAEFQTVVDQLKLDHGARESHGWYSTSSLSTPPACSI